MNRFEAQIPYTLVFVHMSYLKEISPIYIYKIFLNIVYYLQTPFCLLYLVLIKTILKTIKIFSKPFPKISFWPAAVDRAVDRLCFRSDRSTDRSTGLLTVGCVHVCTFPGRPGGRPDPTTVDRPLADCKSAILCLLRSIGGRNDSFILKPGRPAGRPRLCFQP